MENQHEIRSENDKVVLIGIPVFNQVPLLQPYPVLRDHNTFKVCLQDLANLVIPIVCVFGIIALVIYIISLTT